ncbi:MAG: ATP-binding protein [Phycisphaerae bacterium]
MARRAGLPLVEWTDELGVFARPEFDGPAYWHALAAAVLTERLAAHFPPIVPLRAFAAALLAELGRISLALHLPKAYGRLVRHSAEVGAGLAALERESLGFDAAQVGRRLCAWLRLPVDLAECAWLEGAAAVDEPSLAGVVAAGRHLAAKVRPGWDHARPTPREPTARRCWPECRPSRGGALLASIDGELEQLVRIARLTRSGAARQATLRGASLCPIVRPADALRAFDGLGAALDPAALLPRLARRLARALDQPAVLLADISSDARWAQIALGCRDGRAHVQSLALAESGPGLAGDLAALSAAGRTILPAPASADRLLTAYPGWFDGPEPRFVVPLAGDARGTSAILLALDRGWVRIFARHARSLGRVWRFVQSRVGQMREHRARLDEADAWRQAAARVRGELAERTADRALPRTAELAAGLAHELNNPLAIISGRAQQLLAGELDGGLRSTIESIDQQARRAAEIVADLSRYADPPAPQLRAVAVGELLADVQQRWLASGRVGAGQVGVEVSDDLPPIAADVGQLGEVLDCLIANSVEATAPESRRITIKARLHPTDDFVSITVVDNGRGMSPDVRERALDPFFSRRPAGRGRGMGLSRVDRLVRHSGGRVRLTSTPDRGTTVELILPIFRSTEPGPAADGIAERA